VGDDAPLNIEISEINTTATKTNREGKATHAAAPSHDGFMLFVPLS
jgi:hypothetical protein